MKLQNNTSSYFSRCDGHLKKNLHTRPARGFRKKNYNPPTAVLVIGKDGQVSDRLGPCRPQTQIYPSFGMGPVVLVPNESATNLLGPVWAQHLSKPGPARAHVPRWSCQASPADGLGQAPCLDRLPPPT